jgi:hypothetical protein
MANLLTYNQGTLIELFPLKKYQIIITHKNQDLDYNGNANII